MNPWHWPLKSKSVTLRFIAFPYTHSKSTILAKRVWDTSRFPPLFGIKDESDRQYAVVTRALPRFPPPT